jgi:hypothetical protein
VRSQPRQCRDAWGAHLCGCGLAFEAGGANRLAVDHHASRSAAGVNDVFPQAVDTSPLPDHSRGNGGRCSRHSFKILLLARSDFIEAGPSLTPASPGANKVLLLLTTRRGPPRRGRRRPPTTQFTKRRSLTFITRPIARKTNNVAEPP